MGQQDVVFDVAALAELVFGLKKGADPVGKALGVGAHDLGCPVRGGVVVDQDLHGKVGFLREKALQSLPNIGFMIVGDADYRDHTGLRHGQSLPACFDVPL